MRVDWRKVASWAAVAAAAVAVLVAILCAARSPGGGQPTTAEHCVCGHTVEEHWKAGSP